MAQNEAVRFHHEYVASEHVLLGLIREDSGVAAFALKAVGLDLSHLRAEVEKFTQSGAAIQFAGDRPLTPSCKRVISNARDIAAKLGHTAIGTEHLLLGLVAEMECTASKILEKLNLKQAIVENVHALLGNSTGQAWENLGTALWMIATTDPQPKSITSPKIIVKVSENNTETAQEALHKIAYAILLNYKGDLDSESALKAIKEIVK